RSPRVAAHRLRRFLPRRLPTSRLGGERRAYYRGDRLSAPLAEPIPEVRGGVRARLPPARTETAPSARPRLPAWRPRVRHLRDLPAILPSVSAPGPRQG